MNQTLSDNYIHGDNLLIAYLDLCGTKLIYSKCNLQQQIDRILKVMNNVIENVLNTFDDESKSIFLHMYADSVVIAERPNSTLEDCADKFLNLLIKLQYEILMDSESFEIYQKDFNANPNRKSLYMPVLSRALIKRGRYYGLIIDKTKMDNLFSNFSLVGGPAIVEMDKTLQGLPMGTYIDASIIDEFQIEKDRLLDVAGHPLKFVKPLHDFNTRHSIFSPDINNRPENLDDWGKRLIESTGNDIDFKSKLIPWIDVIQRRRQIIAKRAKKQRGND